MVISNDIIGQLACLMQTIKFCIAIITGQYSCFGTLFVHVSYHTLSAGVFSVIKHLPADSIHKPWFLQLKSPFTVRELND